MSKRNTKRWKRIDTQEIQDALEKETREQRQRKRVDTLSDAELFVIDTEQDSAAVSPAQIKRRRREPKILRCQAILNASSSAKPVARPIASKPKGPAVSKKKGKLPAKQVAASASAKESHALDNWGTQSFAQSKKRPKRISNTLKAVEIDAPGCSYNPHPNAHQDAIAEAVAAEVRKQNAEEVANPVKLLALPEVDELDALLVDSEPEDEDEEEAEADVVLDELASGSHRRPAKKTRTVRNREKRRREAEAALASKKSLKRQRHALENLAALKKQLDQEAAEAAAWAERKAADKEELKKTKTPRLGRAKFEPSPIQVLLSEEVDGSLRRLKGTPMLALERFKSLQKRGVIEPLAKRKGRLLRGRKVAYTPGEGREKLQKAHEETQRFLKAGAEKRAKAHKERQQ